MGVRDIVFTCVVFYNMLRTHQDRAESALTTENDVLAQQNDQAVYVPNENNRNPSREAKHQRKVLKGTWGIDWAGGQDLRCSNTGGRSWHLSFSGLLSILSRTAISLFQD